jgi:hypothetical protein
MRWVREILESLQHAPMGHSVDGRRIGIGLSAAMTRDEQGLPGEVEEYLRAEADVRNMSS